MPLVVRGPRGARLTEAGQVLARHGKTIDDACVAARRDLAGAVGEASTRLRIGTFGSAAIRLLPGRHDRPAPPSPRERPLHRGGHQHRRRRAGSRPACSTWRWWRPTTTHRTGRGGWRPSRCSGTPSSCACPWSTGWRRATLRDGSGSRSCAESGGWPSAAATTPASSSTRAAEAVDLRPQVQFETEAYDVARASPAGTGLGVSVLPPARGPALTGVVHRELERPRLHRRLWALQPRDLRFTPLAGEFVSLLAEVAGGSRSGGAPRRCATPSPGRADPGPARSGGADPADPALTEGVDEQRVVRVRTVSA